MPEFDVDVMILDAGTAGQAACRGRALKHIERTSLTDGGTFGIAYARVGYMQLK